MPMTLDSLYEVRRENLRRLVTDRFDGKRMAFAREAGVHHNHINLILSSNEDHRRNMGEPLARRIEQALGLQGGWLDRPHGAGSLDIAVPILVASRPIKEELKHIFRPSDIPAMVVTQDWVDAHPVSHVDNLFITCLASDAMAPEISPGDRLLVDGGVKAVSSDGIYVLHSGKEYFLRRVRKVITGGWSITCNDRTDPGATLADLKGIKTVGRILAIVPKPVTVN